MSKSIKELTEDFESKLHLTEGARLKAIREELIEAGLSSTQADFFAMLCDDLESAGFRRGYNAALNN